jgi:hypothetical protein
MPTLRVASWNVANLFEPGAVDRGPRSEAELNAKITRLAEIADRMFDGAGPDLLGLAEVGTERILDVLGATLQDAYLPLWSAPGSEDQTGLALLGRDVAVAQLELVDGCRPSAFARPRCMVVRCWLTGVTEPVLVVMNHWKSRMQQPGLDDRAERVETARWLGDLLAGWGRETCVLVMGDFNAEPFEAPFSETSLRGLRFFSSTLWSQATPAYLYNATWRFLPEPDSWETARQPGYREPRPKTSHDSQPAVLFDQLLVSGSALRGGPLELRETTVGYHCDPVASRHKQSGALVPIRWEYVPGETPVGASDHFPLVATFEIV